MVVLHQYDDDDNGQAITKKNKTTRDIKKFPHTTVKINKVIET